ncbi:hypothetical protein MP228_003802 [Amoeboaphelidium protococcarum]|nr:hypothetical protein MP228_003802 [Amoeboaphelidium protococcarum]
MKSILILAFIAIGVIAITVPQFPLIFTRNSAKEKQDQLWDRIIANKNSAEFYGPLKLLTIFLERMGVSFDHEKDTMPSFRDKLIHSQGVVAKIRWEPVASQYNYTGLFSTGAQYGFIRFSSATKPLLLASVPGAAVKLFRDNIKSANFMAMFSLDGQASLNFFKNNFTTHVAIPKNPALKLLALKFKQGSKEARCLGLSDLATFDQSGEREEKPWFPFEISLVPSKNVAEVAERVELDLNQDNWKDQFNSQVNDQLSPNVVLYNVYARDSPREEFNTHIANIVLTSRLTTSEFGDRKLFFQHQRFEDDIAVRGDYWGESGCSQI